MYGLIGKKLGHSFSADFFNKKFKTEGIDESYQLFPLASIDEFPSLLKKHPDLNGLNVTIPYKQQVIPFLDELSEEAEKIGAINVIKINKRGNKLFLKGYNSDAIGFRDSLLPLLNPEIQNALILGTGGASKAVAYVLKQLGLNITFVSRNPVENNQISYNQLTPDIISDNLLIVNTTPLGMYPDIDNCPPIPYQYLTPRHLCYDIVYNPMETKFMKLSSEHGALVKNGIDMLKGQAVAAWDIWTNSEI